MWGRKIERKHRGDFPSLSTSPLSAKIVELLTDGLQYDGAHHKQWCLNEVLKLIDKKEADLVESWTGDTGVAP